MTFPLRDTGNVCRPFRLSYWMGCCRHQMGRRPGTLFHTMPRTGRPHPKWPVFKCPHHPVWGSCLRQKAYEAGGGWGRSRGGGGSREKHMESRRERRGAPKWEGDLGRVREAHWQMATRHGGGQFAPVPLQTGSEDSVERTSPPPAAGHCPPPGPSPILPRTRALRPEAGTPLG